jgi:hypothetical protein
MEALNAKSKATANETTALSPRQRATCAPIIHRVELEKSIANKPVASAPQKPLNRLISQAAFPNGKS